MLWIEIEAWPQMFWIEIEARPSNDVGIFVLAHFCSFHISCWEDLFIPYHKEHNSTILQYQKDAENNLVCCFMVFIVFLEDNFNNNMYMSEGEE